MMVDFRKSGLVRAPIQARGAEHRHSAGRKRLLRWAPLALVALLLAIGYAFGLQHYLSLDTIRSYQASLAGFVAANAVAAAAAYFLVYVAAVTLSFPGASILTAAGGLMFGCVAGTALAWLAATIGATLIFLVARTSLGDFLAERAGSRMQRLREGFQRNGFSYLLFLRLVPLFPFWLINLAAALFGMRLLPYVAATAIGIVPGSFVLSYFGEGLATALDGEGPAISLKLFVGLVLLGVTALVPVAFRKWRRGAEREQGAPS